MSFTFDPKSETFVMSSNKKSVYDFYEMSGFNFSKEIITRYFLSLMTKPFVILTGISGTGKTKITQLFARYALQNYSKEKQEQYIAFIPVRPDWMDKKGLLGFFNVLDEKYSAPPTLRVMLSAMDNPEIAHFIILDEMNLAKVEHYFSDFLSILESRTKDNPEGEVLYLHDRQSAQTTDGLEIPGKMHIPANVYFTGTVNVDESTYMFSPKVLDRANVIEFNEVYLDPGANVDQRNRFQLTNDHVIEAFQAEASNLFCSREDLLELRQESLQAVEILGNLLNILKEYNMHFGYRVINEISRYILLSKKYVYGFDPYTVLDIQILQKILPKFHGTQTKLEEPLSRVFNFVTGTDLDADSKLPEKARFPRTARKVKSMLKSLRDQGYADFIE
jgi:5-methylcytosine-specific restriction enzyme B